MFEKDLKQIIQQYQKKQTDLLGVIWSDYQIDSTFKNDILKVLNKYNKDRTECIPFALETVDLKIQEEEEKPCCSACCEEIKNQKQPFCPNGHWSCFDCLEKFYEHNHKVICFECRQSLPDVEQKIINKEYDQEINSPEFQQVLSAIFAKTFKRNNNTTERKKRNRTENTENQERKKRGRALKQ